MREYMLKRYHNRRKIAFDIVGRTCAICKLMFPDSMLELDHVDPHNKNLSFAREWNSKNFFVELEKAQALCSACHTNKTLADLGRNKSVCGTDSHYRHKKCRCDLCKAAHSAVRKT